MRKRGREEGDAEVCEEEIHVKRGRSQIRGDPVRFE